jgi:hypothetical protein
VPFVRAERGMFDETPPLYPDPGVPSRLAVTTVPDSNHYSILFGDAGVSAVVADCRQPDRSADPLLTPCRPSR